MKLKRVENCRNRLVVAAIELVAEMFEYAKCQYKLDCNEFFRLFNNSNISEKIYEFNIVYVYGKSSIELVDELCANNNIKVCKNIRLLSNPKYYWLGIVIACYCFA